jgi:hypothetical protein
MNITQVSEKQRLTILRSHASKSVLIRAFPELLQKSKKYGWKSGTCLSASVRVRRGNPGPRLPTRGRKSYVPSMIHKQSKLTIAKNRIQRRFDKRVLGIYLLTENARYSIFEAVIDK